MECQLHAISRHLYQLLTLKLIPYQGFIGQNVAWFATEDRRLLVVVLDFTDRDYNAVILGRDTQKWYRCISVKVSYPNLESAVEAAQEEINSIPPEQSVFPQGDEGKTFDIFAPVVPENRQHKNYKVLLSQGHSPAREVIQELCFCFKDKDGNFREQFQSNGFNARLFELYMFAFLHEEKFIVDESSSYPDFIFKKGYNNYAIECTTVNKGQNDISEFPEDPEQQAKLLRHYFPIKFGSPLYSKLIHKSKGSYYWDLPKVKGHPFIIAIEDFHFEDAMCYSYPGLEYYLYGYEYDYERNDDGAIIPKPQKITSFVWGEKTLDTCFFDLPESENISAVLLINTGTLAKFNRMGKIAGLGNETIAMYRNGLCFNPDPKSVTPIPFFFEVNETTNETWAEGARMYHNPHAKYPVDIKDFTGIYHGYLDKNNCLLSICPPFFPFRSRTHTCVIKGNREKP